LKRVQKLRRRNMLSSAIGRRSMTRTMCGQSIHSRSTPCKSLVVLFSLQTHVRYNSYNTFASGGSDGTVSIWDHKVKKRLRQYPKYSGPVPSIAFNCDGTRLAVGVSYTWDEGEEGAKGAEMPAVFVKACEDVKVRLFIYFL
jgi:WD40 repeat protein